MVKIITCSFIIILVAATNIPAQSTNHQLWEVKSFGINDGLVSRTINATICDHRGAMWFATNLGLNVYDGQKFDLYTDRKLNSNIYLPGTSVHDIAEDPYGNIWVCTSKGLTVINSARSSIVPTKQLGIPDSIASQGLCFIEARPEGGLWLICNQFLYQCQNKEGRFILIKKVKLPFIPTSQTKIACSKNGELWMMNERTIHVWKKGNFHHMDYQVYDQKAIRRQLGSINPQLLRTWGDSITLIYNHLYQTAPFKVNHSEKKWFLRHEDQSFFSRLAYLQVLKNYIEKSRPAAFRQYSIQEVIMASYNQIWIITNNEVYVAHAHFPQHFQQLEFARQRSIRGIAETQQGELWVSLYDELYSVTKTRIKKKELIVFWDIEQIGKDSILMGLETNGGLALASSKDGVVNIYKQFSYYFVLGLQRIGDNIWFVHDRDQLTCMSLRDWRVVQQIDLDGKTKQSINGFTKCLIKGRGTDLWAAGDGGVYKISKGKNGMYKIDNQGVPDLIRNMPTNALFLGKDGTLWIGSTNNGLWSYKIHSKKLRQYTIQDGLANNTIFSIIDNADGSAIWVGTANGLCRLQPSSDLFTNYFEQDGLAHNEFNTSSAYRAKDGQLYFGGVNGVTYFRENRLDHSIEPIQAYPNIKETNLATGLSNTFIPKCGDHIKLPAHKQLIEINFFCSDLFNAEMVKYKYRIIGQSNEWRVVSAKENLVFGKMEAGDYRLELRAISPQGTLSPLYYLDFRVPNFWYRTWWFYFSVGTLIFLTSYVIFQFRLAELKKLYSIRKQIADDLHDDLGSRLQALKTIGFKIMSQSKSGEPITQLINDLEDMSKDALGVIRNFIWAFDPKKDLAQDLVERMEDFVNISIRPIVPKISFQHTGQLENIKVAPTVKHHCLLAFQEVLINMRKHTDTQEINVLVHVHQHSCTLHILNSFQPLMQKGAIGEGYGNESIQHRIKEIGGQFIWKNHQGQQEAEITIPFS